MRTKKNTSQKRGTKPISKGEHICMVFMQVLLFINLLLSTVLLFGANGENAIPLTMLIWVIGGVALWVINLMDRW